MKHNPSLDLGRAGDLANATEQCVESPELAAAVASIRERRGLGHEFLGWLDLPERSRGEMMGLRESAAQLRSEIDTLVVVGIGGSYLGTRAVLDALRWKLWKEDGPELLFAGHHLEGSALEELLSSLEGREFAVNVISKSGTTTEPAIAFRLLREQMDRDYGQEKAVRRIVATTDATRGALRTLADEEGYRSFVVPDDVGGRFSVLSAVGLFPLAVAGVDIADLLDGAVQQMAHCLEAEVSEIEALRYAAYRHCAYTNGAAVEVLASFHPSLHHLAEWWKQLFGESEGKDAKGLFPAAVDYTTDLHSLGQAMQDGPRMLMETFLRIRLAAPGPTLPSSPRDLDGLEYLAGRSVGDINATALDAVAEAHRAGGIPVAELLIDDLEEPSLGSLLAFFEFSCAVSGRLLGVNPFDQPGVEAYKVKLFRLLGRPGP
jgi:glucose-6-phosphate isomerase